MTYRIEIDRDLCLSSGRCVADAPDLVRFDDDEIAAPVPVAPVPDDARVLGLARVCPSGALAVRDTATGAEIDVF